MGIPIQQSPDIRVGYFYIAPERIEAC